MTVFAALGFELRWQIILLLADGQARSISDVASAFQRDLDGIGKQLRVLEKAGLLNSKFGQDRRFTLYSVPPELRAEPGTLDLGFCRLQLSATGKVV